LAVHAYLGPAAAAKETLIWQRFVAEMRKFALVASFLFFFLGAFATYRRLILSEYQIDYFQYGYALIESLVLGKVILLGEIFHLGDRFHGKPLIVPTLYRTFSFSILVLVFAVLEHFVKGFIHGENIAVIFGELAAKGGAEIGSRILVMFIAFIPMFAIWEIANLFAEGKLFELFFERGGTAGNSLPDMTKAASLRQG
jgi:hypothetical protein